jgi:membrane protein
MNQEPIVAGAAPAPESQARAMLVRPWKNMLTRRGIPTLRYLVRPEAHTFAFSVAANAILSFFPFMVLLMWLVRNVLHSQSMADVLVRLFLDHLPITHQIDQKFVIRNLNAVVNAHHGAQLLSIVMLLISSSGVFLPLEVAFNQIWGFGKNRSYLGNQLISLLLALACGFLALLSVALAAGNQYALAFLLQGSENIVFRAVTFITLKLFAMAASVAIFFLIYWLLPNGKIAARSVAPAAVAMGVIWELAKYAYMLALPWLNFPEVYGPFYISITLMFWAFISGLLILAGAHLAAEPATVQVAAHVGASAPVANLIPLKAEEKAAGTSY